MKFDDILKTIGEFGPYQIRIYMMVCLVAIPVAMDQFAHVFFSAHTDHWCDVPAWQKNYDTCEELLGKDDEYLGCLYKYRNASIPIEEDDGESFYSECYQYDVNYREYQDGYYAGAETNGTTECEGWIYDKSEYTRTIRTDFDLVCDDKAAADLTQSAWFVGVLVGSLIFGQLSDIAVSTVWKLREGAFMYAIPALSRVGPAWIAIVVVSVARRLGRYYTFYISVSGLFVMSLTAAFMPSYWSFTTARSISGAFNMGTYMLAFVIGTELVGPSKRVLAGMGVQGFFAIGYMVLATIAYLVRDWRILQVIVVLPFVLIFLAIPFVPESCRWLITKQRYDEAEGIIKKAARVNKKEESLPDDIMGKLKEAEESKKDNVEKTATMLDLFKTSRLRLHTLNLMYNWFINSLVYYGLSLSTSDLGSNDFVAFFISGAVEIPAYIICIPMMESPLGRKYTTMGFELLGGFSCLLTIFFPSGAARTSIAMVGKFAISASFGIIYMYAAEIFPTPVRTAGIGLCSVAARISGILAPVILLLDEYWEPFSLVIFGSTCIIGGLLVFFLPETRGRRLPETLAEAEGYSMESMNADYEEDGEAIPSTEGETNIAYEGDENKI